MIGITVKISYDILFDKGTYIIIKVNPKDRKLFSDIDNYFNEIVQNYEKIMINNNIKIKKHNEYSPPSDKTITITMNSIKRNTSDKNKVQIFSI